MSKFSAAFGRPRMSSSSLDSKTAAVGVHKSLFSNLQQVGFDGSAAALVAWAMVKAVRPKMADHKAAIRSIEGQSSDDLQSLRDVAVKTSRSEKTSNSPARAELIGDIICMLDGAMSRGVPAQSARPGLAAVEALADAMSVARSTRCAELMKSGKSPAEALAIVEAEGL